MAPNFSIKSPVQCHHDSTSETVCTPEEDDKNKGTIGILQRAQKIIDLPKDKILKYSQITLVLFVVFGIGQAIFTTLLGVVYPILMRFHALKADILAED
jgi:hypothetical protein